MKKSPLLWGYCSKALVFLVSQPALVKAHGRRASWCKGIGQAGLKTTLQLKSLVTSLFPSSLLYIMTFLRAHFPQLQPLLALHQPWVKLWWLQSHFLGWLSSGSAEMQQPPHLHLPLWDCFELSPEGGRKRYNPGRITEQLLMAKKSQGCFCRLQQARLNRDQGILTASSNFASKLGFYSIFEFEVQLIL